MFIEQQRVKLAAIASFGAFTLAAASASATYSTTPAQLCQFSNPSTESAWSTPSFPAWRLLMSGSGVTNPDGNSHYVSCGLARNEAAATAQSATVYVDGNSFNNQPVSCTIYQYDFLNNLKSSVNVSSTLSSFDLSASFSAVGGYDYLIAQCLMRGSQTNVLRGFAVMQ